MGELRTDVVAILNDRAADVAANRLVSKFAAAGKTSGEEFAKAMEAEAQRTNIAVDNLRNSLERRLSDAGGRAGRGFGQSFGGEMARAIPGISGFASTMDGYDTAAGKMGALAGRAMGMAFTTAAAGLIGAAGYTLFKGFERYEAIDAAKNRLDNLNRSLAQTGRTGFDVKAVMETVNATVEGTPFALDKAFSVATRALASPTGDLKRFMTVVSDAAGFAGASIEDIGDAFLKIANTGKVSASELNNELRNIPISAWLQEELGVSGAALAKMVTENKVGLEDLMRAVESNATGFAKAAGDTVSGALSNMQTAVARLGANFLGAIFGQPTDDANTLKDAIKAVTDRLNEVNKWVTEHQADIRRVFKEGVAAAQDLANAIGWVIDKIDLIPGGITTVVGAFVAWKAIAGVTALTTQLGGINTMLSTTLPAAAATGAAGITAALSKIAVPLWLTTLIEDKYPNFPIQDQPDGEDRLFPGWVPILPAWEENIRRFAGEDQPGGLPRGPSGPPQSTAGSPDVLGDLFGLQPGLSFPGGIGGAAGAQAERRGGRMPDLPGGTDPSGAPILAPPGVGDGTGGGSGPRLPGMPVVPYDTTLPPGLPGMPQDASVFSAESSFLDARHRLAEKQARLSQLQNEANATEEDRLNARNDVFEAERDLQGAEMRMGEARASQYQKMTKQTEQHVRDLGQLGAQLDQDFGISKGLAGIAENITKFVANLAAAPLLGQLGAVSATAPTQGGHGVMGILGAQGVFGSQFQNDQYAEQMRQSYAAAAMGPAAFQPGMAYPGVPQAGASTGQPYGLPAGTNTGGYGTGSGKTFPAWVMQLADQFGVKPSTYSGHQEGDRHEAGYAPNPNRQNRGIDWSGPVENMQRFADYLATIPNSLEQVIWQNPNTGRSTEIAGGRPQPGYFSGDLGGHRDHVHTRQSAAIPLPGAYASQGAYSPVAPYATSGGAGTGAVGPGMAGPPQSPFFNSPALAGGVGASAAAGGLYSPTRIGGGDGLSGTGSGGVGIDGGGAMGMALGAGAMAADMMLPGTGQAAQMGAKLINRGIEYGGQVAGIAAQGVMDTFAPFGGSELASNNWLTRIVGGFAGAAPALPNLAGKSSQPSPEDVANIDPAAAARGEVAPANNTTNITVNNQRQTEDGTGRDIAYHQQQANMAPGM